MKSGKFTLGTKTAVKTLRNGKGACRRAWQQTEPCQAHWLLAVGPSSYVISVARRVTDVWAVMTCAAKLIIISNNTPPIRKSEIEYYAMLSKTGVHHYGGSACSPQPSRASMCRVRSVCRALHPLQHPLPAWHM